ncbi:hypothetical protein [Marinoscillum pacificum]|uniref:hypothetical protein n=1 Tax=Marinoscillum pacificum TaxID=392723 RepID=UPI0021586D3C|nr:hypothetical protein [Marinoscillum pacificum]
MKFAIITNLLFLLNCSIAIGQATEEPLSIKTQIDCRGCDGNYMRQNITFLDHVRDQDLAEIYVFVNTSGNPSSVIYEIEYTGKGRFEGINNKFSVDYSKTLTGNEIRDLLKETLIKGYIPYLLHTDQAEQLELVLHELPKTTTEKIDDPWNNWIFSVRGNMDMEHQDTREEFNYDVGFDGDKVTEHWRVRLDGYYNKNTLKITESDNSSFTSVRNRKFLGGSIVKSLGNHWSAGVFGDVGTNSVDNFKFKSAVAPAIEYSLFDYKEVLTREITFAYQINYNTQKYFETTIFDVLRDQYYTQSLSMNLTYRKNWGSVYSSVRASNFLNDPSKNRLSINNWASVRVFKGFSVRVNANFQVIKDQINLPKGEASLEDIILQQRALATTSKLNLGVGMSYTFGSIFNNVLNTRL